MGESGQGILIKIQKHGQAVCLINDCESFIVEISPGCHSSTVSLQSLSQFQCQYVSLPYLGGSIAGYEPFPFVCPDQAPAPTSSLGTHVAQAGSKLVISSKLILSSCVRISVVVNKTWTKSR